MPWLTILRHCNTYIEKHALTHSLARLCNALQHTASHCNTLQHTATHCNTLQHSATHCNTLQHALLWLTVSRDSVILSGKIRRYDLILCGAGLRLRKKKKHRMPNIWYTHIGWRRCIGCLKLQVCFRKRATNCRALWQKMKYQDKASYASSPPCTYGYRGLRHPVYSYLWIYGYRRKEPCNLWFFCEKWPAT